MKRILPIILLLAALAFSARAQLTPTTLANAINGPIVLTTTSSNLISSQWNAITVQQGKGLAIAPLFVGADATNTVACGFLFAVSTDGTNYSTTTPIVASYTATGVTAVRGYTLIPATSLDHARFIKLLTITNGSANLPSITVTNVLIGIRN